MQPKNEVFGHGDKSLHVLRHDLRDGIPCRYEVQDHWPAGRNYIQTMSFRYGMRYLREVQYGLTDAAMLAIVIDRLRAKQQTELASRSNLLALERAEESLMWLKTTQEYNP